MAINLSYYDVTQLDYIQDSNDNGAIVQSGTWVPLVPGKERTFFGIGEERLKHRGNLQTLLIDQRVKRWGIFELEYIAMKYEASPSPAWDWWDIVNKTFYGGATGAPVLRPGTIFLASKLNRATPEYWTLSGAKLEQVVIRGSMITGAMTVALRGVSRGFRIDTNNYQQGTATRRADPAKTPIVPASDVTIKVNNIDETANVQEFVLTLSRALERRGRSATASDTSSQIGLSGLNYREFVPNTFDGRLDLILDPFGTTSTQLLNQLNDTALNTCEIQAQNTTNGKQIQFTASKINDATQRHETGRSPSAISLGIDGATFNVNTL